MTKIIFKRQDRRQILVVSCRREERFAYMYVCNKNIRFFVELLRPLKRFRCIIQYRKQQNALTLFNKLRGKCKIYIVVCKVTLVYVIITALGCPFS